MITILMMMSFSFLCENVIMRKVAPVDVCLWTMILVSIFSTLVLIWTLCRKFWSSYFGKNTAATKAALPSPTSVCGVSVSQSNGDNLFCQGSWITSPTQLQCSTAYGYFTHTTRSMWVWHVPLSSWKWRDAHPVFPPDQKTKYTTLTRLSSSSKRLQKTKYRLWHTLCPPQKDEIFSPISLPDQRRKESPTGPKQKIK